MNWWDKEAVYQIYPKSFKDSNGDGIGDINGITQKLEYIKELGVGAIWICPLFDSPQLDGGYDICDYYGIYPPFGNTDDLTQFIDKAHSLGIRVIMDLVVNHTSDKHPWFLKSRKKQGKYKDYYYWRKGKDGQKPSNWAAAFIESAWTFDHVRGEYYFGNFSSAQPDLNWNNPDVIDEVCAVMKYWQDRGVDGWRIDAIPYIDKNPEFPDYNPADFPPGNKYFMGKYHYKNGHLEDFIRILNDRVWKNYKDTVTVAEIGEEFSADEIAELTVPGDTFSMAFTFDHLFHDVDWSRGVNKWCVKKFDLPGFKKAIAKGQTLPHYAIFLNNHDQPRSVSILADCGNYRIQYAKALAIMLHMLKGTPFIYQGEELGMTNCTFEFDEYRDIDFFGCYKTYVEGGKLSREEFLKAAAVRCRDNARTPMQWDDSCYAGFSESEPWIKLNPNYKEINAANQLNDQNSVFSCYKLLLALRKKYDIISFGDFCLLDENDVECMAYERRYKGERLVVYMNFTADNIKRNVGKLSGGRLLIASYPDCELQDGYRTLRPFEAFAVLLNKD